MESIFGMEAEMEQPAYLQALMQHVGSSYICLWSRLPHPNNHSNLLVFSGGFYLPLQYYEDDQQQPSSSSSSSSSAVAAAANRHFQDYTQSTFTPINDRVPGRAFSMDHPYVELNEPELLRMASILPQRLFYQEAKIKTAVFMGCRSGEIELGWSNVTAQLMSIESEMMKLFPDDFSTRLLTSDHHLTSSTGQTALLATNPTPPAPGPSSSPTSSLRSVVSLENSPDEYSSFLLNLTHTTTSPAFPALHPPPPPHQQQATTTTTTQQPYVGLLPTTQAKEDAAMTRALLAVFTSPPPTISSPANQGRNPAARPPRPRTTTAFKKFSATPSSPTTRGMISSGTTVSSSSTSSSSNKSSSVRMGQSMFKRAITYYRRSFMMMRSRERMNMASRPTSTQLHHMISERRRREKINDSFQSLRSILPPDAKKDKASVLSRTKEYMSALIAQVTELAEKNRQLESKLLLLNFRPLPSGSSVKEAAAPEPADYERVDVRLAELTSSSSEERRVVELQVTLRGDSPQLVSDMVIRVLEFLRQVNNHVDLIALEANATTLNQQMPRFSRAVFRLHIQGGEWDEAAFQEAVRRVVADLAQ